MTQDQEALYDKITRVQVNNTTYLMSLAHVVGLGVGLAKVNGQVTDQMALIVLVDKKVPLSELTPGDIVPRYIGDVRCDVQETGPIHAQ